MKLSVVLPVRDEAPVIPDLVPRLTSALDELDESWEVIFVDDGSRDSSWALLEGAAEHAFPLYTLADAVRLRDHVLQLWDAADRDPALVDDGALDIVVVGGGPTGIETAGALAELYNGVLRKDYPDLPHDETRIVLVEAGPEIFPMFKPDIRAYTEEALAKRTVEVMTGEPVAG